MRFWFAFTSSSKLIILSLSTRTPLAPHRPLERPAARGERGDGPRGPRAPRADRGEYRAAADKAQAPSDFKPQFGQ